QWQQTQRPDKWLGMIGQAVQQQGTLLPVNIKLTSGSRRVWLHLLPFNRLTRTNIPGCYGKIERRLERRQIPIRTALTHIQLGSPVLYLAGAYLVELHLADF